RTIGGLMNRALRVQKCCIVFILTAVIVFVWGAIHGSVPSLKAGPKPNASANSRATESKQWDQVYGKLSMTFEANRGQSDPAVQFLSRGHGYSLFLTSAEAVLVLSKTQEHQDAPWSHPLATHESRIEDSKSAVLRMRLGGAANTVPKV